jgi:hypothetical protein
MKSSLVCLIYILEFDAESDHDSDPYQPSTPPSPSPQQMEHLFSMFGYDVDFDALDIEQGIRPSNNSSSSPSSSESDEGLLEPDQSLPETEMASLTLAQVDAMGASRGVQ